MACPIDKETIYLVEQLTQLRVKPTLSRITEIEETIARYYAKGKTGSTPHSVSSPSTIPTSESKITKTTSISEEPHSVSFSTPTSTMGESKTIKTKSVSERHIRHPSSNFQKKRWKEREKMWGL
jgi:hypothetical protein